jgi:hypothetical protein
MSFDAPSSAQEDSQKGPKLTEAEKAQKALGRLSDETDHFDTMLADTKRYIISLAQEKLISDIEEEGFRGDIFAVNDDVTAARKTRIIQLAQVNDNFRSEEERSEDENLSAPERHGVLVKALDNISALNLYYADAKAGGGDVYARNTGTTKLEMDKSRSYKFVRVHTEEDPTWSIMEGSAKLGQVSLSLNHRNDRNVLSLKDASGTTEVKEYYGIKTIDHFQRDAALQLLLHRNAQKSVEPRSRERLNFEPGHEIILHEGIKLWVRSTRLLQFTWSHEQYQSDGGAYYTNIGIDADAISRSGDTYLLFKEDRLVGEIRKSARADEVRFSVYKAGRRFAELRLPCRKE